MRWLGALSLGRLGEQCVTGSVSAMNKYTLLLVALQLGIDVMWLDFDIFLVKDPTPSILEAAKAADLLISYDYTSDCVCNGFFYIRSKPSLHQWLFEVGVKCRQKRDSRTETESHCVEPIQTLGTGGSLLLIVGAFLRTVALFACSLLTYSDTHCQCKQKRFNRKQNSSNCKQASFRKQL